MTRGGKERQSTGAPREVAAALPVPGATVLPSARYSPHGRLQDRESHELVAAKPVLNLVAKGVTYTKGGHTLAVDGHIGDVRRRTLRVSQGLQDGSVRCEDQATWRQWLQAEGHQAIGYPRPWVLFTTEGQIA